MDGIYTVYVTYEAERYCREKFDASLSKRQIRPYFPPPINCATLYVRMYVCICLYHIVQNLYGKA